MHGNPQQAVQYAYLAGIIDGEGSMSIFRHSPDLPSMKSNKYKSIKYYASFCIGMSNRNIVQLLADHFGSTATYIERVPNRKPIYRLKVTGRDKLMCGLKKVYPHLIEKRKQADILIKFCDGLITPHNRKTGLCDEELQRREDLYQQIKKLNRSGAAATTEYLGTERSCDSLNTVRKTVNAG